MTELLESLIEQVKQLPPSERDRIATIILEELEQTKNINSPESSNKIQSLKGSVIYYHQPNEPVAEEDWEVLK
ncbi:hypothetical protein FRE64_11865 [Euhalothece natronophila Z-M001]|uniref:DUF2281 domain-containing protein n=1 Tax=Euhalothece natronophila Z-M001 TaxID=522448 RepID=A0A5B8NQP6_9CHRO|nr:hypothetical protein [Euhalothece natronophila]QDZ40589.1 hypothetical protein FRE64_11865 [Euhalothece natronophila Z-M001]